MLDTLKIKLIYFCVGDLFNAVCGYRGHYTDQAMIHFDNNRLHTESKEMNRKKRKEASRVAPQNDDNDETSDDDEPISSDDEQTTDDDERTTDDDEQTTDENDDETSDGAETTGEDTKSSVETSDDDYDYYNPKDKRLWKEQE